MQDHRLGSAYAEARARTINLDRRNQVTQTGAAPTEANRKIIRQAFESWHKGTGIITDVFASDMTWRIEGHSVASKEYASNSSMRSSGPSAPGSQRRTLSARPRSGRSAPTATR